MSRKLGVIFSYILLFLEVASNFLLTPLLLKSFGESQYGVYGLVISVTSYLALLDLGMGNSVVKFASSFFSRNDKQGVNNLAALSLLFYSVTALLCSIFGVVLILAFPSIFSNGLTVLEIELARKMLILTIINTAFTFVFSPFDKLILSAKKYVVQKTISIAKLVIRVILTIIVLFSGGGPVSVLIINTGLTILVGLFSFFYCFVKLNIKPKITKNNASFLKELFSYTFIIFLSMIATQINNMVDGVLIGIIVTSSSTILAIYNIGSLLYQYFQSIGNAINSVLMPGVVSSVEKNDSPANIQKEMVKVGRIVLAFLGIVLVVFFVEGKHFLKIWVGESMIDSYYVAIILMFSMLLPLVQNIGVNYLWAKNKHKKHAIIKLIVVCLNIFLTIELIKWNPLLGSSIGTAISIFVGDTLIMNIIFAKELKIDLVSYFSKLFKGIIPSLLISLFFCCAFYNVLNRFDLNVIVRFFINCIATSSIYIATLLFIGFNSYEKNTVKSIRTKFIRKKRF